MIRYDCLKLLAPRITDELVVTSLSGQKIEWASLSQHPGNLLVGTMGTALGVGMGLAIGLPRRKVIVLESDGSVLLSLFNLATLANLDLKNLIVLVFDNQVYSGTRISEPTATAGKTDLAMMARGAGIEQAVTVTDLAAFQREMEAALTGAALKFIVCKIEESVSHREITRTDLDPLENKYQFVRYLERTEGKPIFRGRGLSENISQRKRKQCLKSNSKDAGEYVNEHYRKVAARWRARVTDAPFMQQLRAGTLPAGEAPNFLQKLGLVHDRDQYRGGGFVPQAYFFFSQTSRPHGAHGGKTCR